MKIQDRLNELNIPNVLCPFGEKISDSEQFDAIRGDILRLLEREEYGTMPPPPESMYVEQIGRDEKICAGKATRLELILHAVCNGKELCFPFRSLIPKKKEGNGRLPAFVLINFESPRAERYFPAEEIIDRGYAVFDVTYSDITSDDGDFKNGVSRVLVPDRALPDAPGKLTVWSWCIMRIIDYIETLDIIDMDYLAVTGHSRLGKTTLLTAAHDERVRFACSNDAGTSGDALARGSIGESIDDITRVFPFWFCNNYLAYRDNEAALPFDQHYLLSLIVPRHIYLSSAREDLWADPKSQFLSLALVNDVYRLYGKRGLIHDSEIPEGECLYNTGDAAFHTRSGVHYFSREDWNKFMDYIDFVRKNEEK